MFYKANEAKIKMDNGVSKMDYERANNAFQDYVNKIKEEAKGLIINILMVLSIKLNNKRRRHV